MSRLVGVPRGLGEPGHAQVATEVVVPARVGLVGATEKSGLTWLWTRTLGDKRSRKTGDIDYLMCNPKISIVVPVLDEAEYINSLVERLRSQDGIAHFEIIVVDGDPRGATIGVIRDDGVITRVAEKGRACQMNAGAEAAKGEILLFLHADTQLPENALAKIEGVLENQNYVAGAFDLSIASKRLSLRFIAARASLRSRITRVPYGDQAIFIRKSYFDKIGGFEEVPLLEDVELMCRIRKRGDKIIILPDLVTTSARRWEKEGVFFTTLRNMLIINLYRLGVSPERLARYYRYGPEKEH